MPYAHLWSAHALKHACLRCPCCAVAVEVGQHLGQSVQHTHISAQPYWPGQLCDHTHGGPDDAHGGDELGDVLVHTKLRAQEVPVHLNSIKVSGKRSTERVATLNEVTRVSLLHPCAQQLRAQTVPVDMERGSTARVPLKGSVRGERDGWARCRRVNYWAGCGRVRREGVGQHEPNMDECAKLLVLQMQRLLSDACIVLLQLLALTKVFWNMTCA